MSNFVPRVNRHVAYLRDIDHAGGERKPPYITNYVKRRSSTITEINVDDTVDLRVGHHSETYLDVSQRTAHGQQGVFVPY